MHSTTARHLLRERIKAQRLISFSIHPLNAMPAKWSDFELTRELMRFGERRDQIELLQAEHEEHGQRLIEHFKANAVEEPVDICMQRFTCVKKTIKTYSRHLEREEALLKSKIKSMKKKEEENAADANYDGPHQCHIVVDQFHHMSVSRLKDSIA